jgi:cystathionine beta-lyase/cystathionine gamma-synthase
MDMFGGMLSFNVEDHINLKLFWENLELFKLAVSLGGVESLIELPRLMTHDSAEGLRRQLMMILFESLLD